MQTDYSLKCICAGGARNFLLSISRKATLKLLESIERDKMYFAGHKVRRGYIGPRCPAFHSGGTTVLNNPSPQSSAPVPLSMSMRTTHAHHAYTCTSMSQQVSLLALTARAVGLRHGMIAWLFAKIYYGTRA